jgi:hypothetical protein
MPTFDLIKDSSASAMAICQKPFFECFNKYSMRTEDDLPAPKSKTLWDEFMGLTLELQSKIRDKTAKLALPTS